MFITKLYSDSIDIVDMQPANEDDGQILLSFIINHFSNKGAKSFSVWCPTHHFMHKIIEKFGFINESPITYFGGRQLNTLPAKTFGKIINHGIYKWEILTFTEVTNKGNGHRSACR